MRSQISAIYEFQKSSDTSFIKNPILQVKYMFARHNELSLQEINISDDIDVDKIQLLTTSKLTWAGLKKASGKSLVEWRLFSSLCLSLCWTPMFMSASKYREKAILRI